MKHDSLVNLSPARRANLVVKRHESYRGLTSNLESAIAEAIRADRKAQARVNRKPHPRQARKPMFKSHMHARPNVRKLNPSIKPWPKKRRR